MRYLCNLVKILKFSAFCGFTCLKVVTVLMLVLYSDGPQNRINWVTFSIFAVILIIPMINRKVALVIKKNPLYNMSNFVLSSACLVFISCRRKEDYLTVMAAIIIYIIHFLFILFIHHYSGFNVGVLSLCCESRSDDEEEEVYAADEHGEHVIASQEERILQRERRNAVIVHLFRELSERVKGTMKSIPKADITDDWVCGICQDVEDERDPASRMCIIVSDGFFQCSENPLMKHRFHCTCLLWMIKTNLERHAAVLCPLCRKGYE